MSDTQLLGEKDRKFKSPTDGRILPVSSKVYKLKDRGEGQVRIVLNAPIEALNDLTVLIAWLEGKTETKVPLLNTLRVATQKAKERCARSERLPYKVVQELDGRLHVIEPRGTSVTIQQSIDVAVRGTSEYLRQRQPLRDRVEMNVDDTWAFRDEAEEGNV